jgi:NtrY N-terminal region
VVVGAGALGDDADTEEASTGVIGPIAIRADDILGAGQADVRQPDPQRGCTLLAVNFITVLLLLSIIGREVWHIVQARERGARLHVQITALFSVVAVVPVVLVAAIATVNLA